MGNEGQQNDQGRSGRAGECFTCGQVCSIECPIRCYIPISSQLAWNPAQVPHNTFCCVAAWALQQGLPHEEGRGWQRLPCRRQRCLTSHTLPTQYLLQSPVEYPFNLWDIIAQIYQNPVPFRESLRACFFGRAITDSILK